MFGETVAGVPGVGVGVIESITVFPPVFIFEVLIVVVVVVVFASCLILVVEVPPGFKVSFVPVSGFPIEGVPVPGVEVIVVIISKVKVSEVASEMVSLHLMFRMLDSGASPLSSSW